ncbi:uncharacterized protein LOC108734071 [Agrilus planipennis]|uniref:Phosphodiesterase n=1 Tax=Agrilus planipennis TaxID=224129 RepID=A0A7F5RLD4_AGRPL|nr:uncharacterized protein LOC108734071 [Agrilus planipennis]
MGSAPLPACTGRFLTMHKRRRKKLITRSLLQDHAILDDISHGQVQHILDKVSLWAFNAFTLETVAGGRSLPVLCVHLFHWYGLFEHFKLEVVHVWKLFTLIEEGYHNTNPYHNSIHATDVTQAMHCFLQENKIKEHLQPIEIMAALIGAVAHDLDHPGVNQNFLIQTQNHLAVLYDNMSVLENHHWRSAIGCLLESGVLDQLIAYKEELEEQIRELILATDINRQQEFLTKFKKHLDEDTLDLTVAENRLFILQIALKCADISNPTRPWEISKKWSLKVCDEFFRQGEYERQLNLPVTLMCDRQSTTVAKIQTGFFEHVVAPLFSEWHRFLESTLSSHMMELLDANWNRWKTQKEAEMAQETQTELSDTEPGDLDVSIATRSSSKQKFSLDIPSVTDFIQPSQASQTGYRRQSLAVPTLESQLGVRRHSVPVHVELQLPRTIYRRESLPQAPNNHHHHHRHSSSGRSTVSPVFSGDSRTSSAGHLREEDELLELAFGSQTSLLSSSSDRQHSSEDQVERPLSAENLLPEPNIASMTSSNGAAAKLSSVLHGSAPPTKALTRQQTFPPPQPYVRMRYMSATVEMTTCPESAQEGTSDSSVSSSREHISSTSTTAVCVTQHNVIPSIAVLSPNNGKSPDSQVPELTLSPISSSPMSLVSKTSSSTSSYKREQENVFEKEKASKLPKLSDTEQKQGKENLDPRLTSSNMLRRGSAPVPFVPLNESDPAGRVLRLPDTHTLRRGSVPTEAVRLSIQKEKNETIASPSTSTVEPFPRYQPQRRGSAPTDLPHPSSLISGFGGGGGASSGAGVSCMLTRHVSLNGKACASRRSKKHQLHRRSSGGPETVCLGGNGPDGGTSAGSGAESSCARVMLLRQPDNNADVLLARRRGSLPIEVLTVGHSVC